MCYAVFMSLDRRTRAALRDVANAHALSLLVLFGSRARAEAHDGSDWDFGYLGAQVDLDGLRLALAEALTSRAAPGPSARPAVVDIDLVDLARVGALLRFNVARDGLALYESRPWLFTDFRIEATGTWLDLEPVVRLAHRSILERLGP